MQDITIYGPWAIWWIAAHLILKLGELWVRHRGHHAWAADRQDARAHERRTLKIQLAHERAMRPPPPRPSGNPVAPRRRPHIRR